MDADQPGFVHEVRRKLPRFHWRPLSGIHAGESLADLQRIALAAQHRAADELRARRQDARAGRRVARMLDPELDPMALIEEESLEVMLTETERRLEPNRLFAYLYTQLDPLTRMPRRVGHVLSELEQGSLKIGIVPTASRSSGRSSARSRTASARRSSSARFCSRRRSSRASTASSGSRIAGFSLAAVIGLYMVWKIIRTPGEL